MNHDYDILVAGGSIAGLTFAAEASKWGAKVLVAEEHPEIGEPEKCDGLVSLRGLRKYGYPPRPDVLQNRVASAVVHSPLGRELAVNAASLEVVVIDRSRFDKQAGEAATGNGAELRTGVRVNSVHQSGDGVEAEVGDTRVSSKYFVDATGPSSSPRKGILPAAKYELEGEWVKDDTVEVYMDNDRYPGFFAWVIPFGRHRAKVGAAGRGISPFRALDGFLEGRPSRIIRRVSSPIYVGGPVSSFVEGRKILVGESAGQVKPTTAGGIMTSIAGAVLAAKWTRASLDKDNPSLLLGYQREWESSFLKEMKAMLRLRGVMEKLSNADIEAIMATVATPKLVHRLSRTDFDFHATAVFGALGVSGLLKMAKVVASAEARSLLAER